MTEPPRPSLRSRLRATTAGSLFWKLVVFLIGLFFVGLGLLFIVLPGPLTIPPVLFGVWLWSTEFDWAERLRLRALAQGRIALAAAKQRPVHTAAATCAGLALLVAGVIAVRRYGILDRLIDSVG